MQGYLWKKASKFGALNRKRYFMLNGQCLVYYKKETGCTTAGSRSKVCVYLKPGYRLSNMTILNIRRSNLNLKTIYGFNIIDSKGHIVVELGTTEINEAKKWIEQLNLAIGLEQAEEKIESDDYKAKVVSDSIGDVFNLYLEEVEIHASRDQWMLAAKKLEYLQEMIKAKSSEISPDSLIRFNEKQSLWKMIQVQSEWAKSILKEYEESNDWIQAIKKEKTTVSYKVEEGNPLHHVKIDTIIDDSFIKLAAILAEPDLSYEYIPFCSESKLLCKPTNMHACAQIILKFPSFFPLSNRDLIIEGRGIDMLENNSVLVALRSIKESSDCQVPSPGEGIVRIDMNGGFHLTPLTRNSCRMCIIFNIDMKMDILSPWMLNHINKRTSLALVHVLNKLLKRFDSTEYKKRLDDNIDFYGDIEKRLEVFFTSKPIISTLEIEKKDSREQKQETSQEQENKTLQEQENKTLQEQELSPKNQIEKETLYISSSILKNSRDWKTFLVLLVVVFGLETCWGYYKGFSVVYGLLVGILLGYIAGQSQQKLMLNE